jgi:hypothetical protein
MGICSDVEKVVAGRRSPDGNARTGETGRRDATTAKRRKRWAGQKGSKKEGV